MTGKKILVADDSLTIQKVIRLALSGDGYEISTVSDGAEALEQASLLHPDVCIIDISLPKKDAYELREIFLSKPDLKNIPVIMMSSTFEKLDEERYQDLTFAGHLIKPFDPAHLRSTLLNVLNAAGNSTAVDTVFERDDYNGFDEQENPKEEISTGEIRSVLNDLPRLDEDLLAGPTVSAQNENIPESKEVFWDAIAPSTPAHSSSYSKPSLESYDPMKALTEDTIKGSGIPQLDWRVVEPGKSPFAQNTPPPKPAATPAPAPVAPPPKTSARMRIDDFADLNPSGDLPMNPTSSGPSTSLAPDDMENMVRDEVRRAVREMAEKVIREELQKLLSNPPV